MKKLLVALVALLVLALACGPSDTSQLGDPAEAKWLSKVMAIEYRQDPVRFELERVGSQIRTYGRIIVSKPAGPSHLVDGHLEGRWCVSLQIQRSWPIYAKGTISR